MPRKICIVEDDRDFGDVLKRSLEDTGATVMLFDRCFKALECLASLARSPEKPDLVLVDNLMPDQLGKDLCLRLRDTDGYNDTPIVLMSGADVSGQLARAAESDFGCSAFLLKPFDCEKVLQILENFGPDEIPVGSVAETRRHIALVAPQIVRANGRFSADGLDVAQVLSDFHSQRFTGTLQFSHHELEKILFLERGELVFAKSNAPTDQIHVIAVRKGLVTAEQVKDARVLADRDLENLGNVLLQFGVLKPHQLAELFNEQVRSIVYSSFLSEEGEYASQENNLLSPEHIRLRFEFPPLLLESIRMSCDEEHLLARLGRGEWILCPTESFRSGLERLNLGPQERRVAALANGTIDVAKLLEESILPEQESLQILYALYCLGYLKVASALAVFVP